MSRIVVFFPDGTFERFDQWPDEWQNKVLPKGTYYWHTGDWFTALGAIGMNPWVEEDKVPKALRAQLLLVNS